MRHAIVGILLLGCLLPPAVFANSPVKDDNLIGRPSPAYEMVDLAGKKVSSQELGSSGKLVLVNFWGLRCGACIEELPHLNSLFARYKDRVEFLGVNVDAVAADILAAQIRKKNINIAFRVIPDPEFRMVDAFKMKGAPFTVIIDPGGLVRYQHENFVAGDEKKIAEVVQALLDGKPVPAH